MRSFLNICRITVILSIFCVGMNVFAAEAEPTMKTSVLPESSQEDATEVRMLKSTENTKVTQSWSEDEDSINSSSSPSSSKQKVYDDMNALLIKTYQTKIDKTLADVYLSVEQLAKDDKLLQAAILKKIAEEVDVRVENMKNKTMSPNRKKILSAIFEYMKTSMEKKISELKTINQ